MIELIITYFFVALVIFSVTRSRTASFTWPLVLVRFIAGFISGIINSNRA